MSRQKAIVVFSIFLLFFNMITGCQKESNRSSKSSYVTIKFPKLYPFSKVELTSSISPKEELFVPLLAGFLLKKATHCQPKTYNGEFIYGEIQLDEKKKSCQLRFPPPQTKFSRCVKQAFHCTPKWFGKIEGRHLLLKFRLHLRKDRTKR